MEQIKTITREELERKISSGDDFVLLEVLGEASYSRGHLPGAIRFQDMDLAEETIPDMDTEVVAYCSSFT